ncbi:major facilitator superfamily domain-containing protein [Aspergillus coremiiformis]|uniref:Major facilitator superfamily domain-containing protein n=1 Tax=Aspergillus coremiiformis TaxID=138285 RepID=A0A5N6YXA7_9EURO|nr:major facilitator superfamily domain-containing protein [Aspergillus coremiiformis]
MTSLLFQPTEAAYSTSSNTPIQYTPVSDRSEDESGPPIRPPLGSLTVKTQFNADGDDCDDGYESYEDAEEKPNSASTEFPKYTAIEEKQIVKRFDRCLVSFLALLYLLSFLDRSNIGNAKIAGMADDLHLSSSQYEWLLTAFYITYILFEWMTLMYRLVPPHIYISLCVCGWGLVACFQSLATSFETLVLLRALLGVAEAAFGPGVPFYLSLFYKREELAFRNGLFISAAPLASSFASSLAWVIVKMSGNGPIAPWRTLFLVEGFPSVIVAVFAWILIPDSPGSAWFLGPRQRMVAEMRMEESKPAHHEPRRGKFNWKEVRNTLVDPKSYLAAFMFFSCNVAFSSMPVFLPTIITDMGYSSVTSQALSAPPFLFAFVVVLITAYISDRNRKRSPYLIMHALISSASYLIIALSGYFHTHLPTTAHTLIRYLCVYPATAGFFSAITLIMTWTMDNRVAKEGKGASIAIMNIIGQCGPLLGTRLYPSVDRPWYIRGMATCSFFMAVVAVLAFVLRVILLRARRTIEQKGDEMEMERAGGGEESEVLMGGRNGRRHVEEKFTYII